jgi:hypothetical protein
MLDPRTLTHAQLAEIVADVQAILWQESRMLPDDPRRRTPERGPPTPRGHSQAPFGSAFPAGVACCDRAKQPRLPGMQQALRQKSHRR